MANELRFKVGLVDDDSNVTRVKEYLIIIWKRFTCKSIFAGVDHCLADLIKHNSFDEIKPPFKTFLFGNILFTFLLLHFFLKQKLSTRISFVCISRQKGHQVGYLCRGYYLGTTE